MNWTERRNGLSSLSKVGHEIGDPTYPARTTVDPVKVFNAIAEIISRRENVKVTVIMGEKEEDPQRETA